MPIPSSQHPRRAAGLERLQATPVKNRPAVAKHPPGKRRQEWSPLMVSVGFCGIALLITVMALSSLLNPELAAQKPRTDTTVHPRSRPTVAVQERQGIPLWVFGAIALTCGVGSLLVSRPFLQTQSGLRQKQFRHRRPAKALPAPTVTSRATPPAPISNFYHPSLPATPSSNAAEPSVSPVPPLLPGHRPTHQPPTRRRSQRPARPQLAKPDGVPSASVTIVSANTRHPLDGGMEPLAEAFDLRKRRSLSSWIKQDDGLL